MPEALISRTTSPGPGVGSGNSHSSTRRSPAKTTPFISLLPNGSARPSAGSARDRQTKAELSSRSEEHTSELQSLMRISYAVFCLKKKTKHTSHYTHNQLTKK